MFPYAYVAISSVNWLFSYPTDRKKLELGNTANFAVIYADVKTTLNLRTRLSHKANSGARSLAIEWSTYIEPRCIRLPVS